MRVTIQQAALNAYASWLGGLMPDVTVTPRWAAADKQRPAKSITIIPAGRRIDEPLDLGIVSKTNVGPTQVTTQWLLAACQQPMQMDVWANTDVERDDILARLDDYLHAGTSSLASAVNPMPVGTGTPINLADGWDSTIADFVFDNPDLSDTTDTVGRSIYRATFTGDAYFMLTVTTLTARQIAINFQLRLSESGNPPLDFP